HSSLTAAGLACYTKEGRPSRICVVGQHADTDGREVRVEKELQQRPTQAAARLLIAGGTVSSPPGGAWTAVVQCNCCTSVHWVAYSISIGRRRQTARSWWVALTRSRRAEGEARKPGVELAAELMAGAAATRVTMVAAQVLSTVGSPFLWCQTRGSPPCTARRPSKELSPTSVRCSWTTGSRRCSPTRGFRSLLPKSTSTGARWTRRPRRPRASSAPSTKWKKTDRLTTKATKGRV
ncbi:unnamed protein product, partial [Ectocarpus sp. 4 AP-2014]